MKEISEEKTIEVLELQVNLILFIFAIIVMMLLCFIGYLTKNWNIVLVSLQVGWTPLMSKLLLKHFITDKI